VYCQNCGKQVDEGERFCKYCGKPVTQTRNPSPLQQQPPPNESEVEKTARFNRHLLMGIVAVIVIVVILVIAVFAYNAYFSSNARVNEVQLRVQYSGSWVGAYTSGGSQNTFSGNGDKTMFLDRPSQNQDWTIRADAMKTDSSGGSLTISILRMDGTVLQSSSSSLGLALVSDDLGK
jgi:Tfp pilus assembly major pilin PilA